MTGRSPRDVDDKGRRCPGCGLAPHPLRTCDGKTTRQVEQILKRLGGTAGPRQ